MSLSELSTDVLRETRADLDHQIVALRERKLAVARELESRFPDPESQDQPATQTAMPGFVESESGAFSPGDPEPDVASRRRRWRR